MDEKQARGCVMQMKSTREQNKASFRRLIEGLITDGHMDPNVVFDFAIGDRSRETIDLHFKGEAPFEDVLREIFIIAGAEQCLEIMNERIIEHLEKQ